MNFKIAPVRFIFKCMRKENENVPGNLRPRRPFLLPRKASRPERKNAPPGRGGAGNPVLWLRSVGTLQIRLDKLIDLSVEHPGGIAGLHFGPQVLDHLVGLKHIAADLVL